MVNDAQRKALFDLRDCKLGREQGRFVADIERRKDADLTPRQDWYLRRLQYMYRSQIGVDIPKPDDFDAPPLVEPITAADLNLREAAGEILVCRKRTELSREREVERMKAWNAGQPRKARP